MRSFGAEFDSSVHVGKDMLEWTHLLLRGAEVVLSSEWHLQLGPRVVLLPSVGFKESRDEYKNKKDYKLNLTGIYQRALGQSCVSSRRDQFWVESRMQRH